MLPNKYRENNNNPSSNSQSVTSKSMLTEKEVDILVKQKKAVVEFVNRVDHVEKNEILERHKALNENVFQEDKKFNEAGLAYPKSIKVSLGTGTFAIVRMGKVTIDDFDYYYAVKKIKSEDALDPNQNQTPNTPPTSPRPPGSPLRRREVKKMIITESELHEILNDIDSDHICVPLTIIKKKNKEFKTQLYQVLRRGDMGNGSTFILLQDNQTLLANEKQTLSNHIIYVLLNTIALLHQNNIYVNDIKAENVLFFSNGNIKLSDFGSAMFIPPTNSPDRRNIEVSLFSDSAYMHPVILRDTVTQTYAFSVNKKIKSLHKDRWATALLILEFYNQKTRQYANLFKSLNKGVIAYWNHISENIDNFFVSPTFQEMPENLQNILKELMKFNISPTDDNILSVYDVLQKFPLDTEKYLLPLDQVAAYFESLYNPKQNHDKNGKKEVEEKKEKHEADCTGDSNAHTATSKPGQDDSSTVNTSTVNTSTVSTSTVNTSSNLFRSTNNNQTNSRATAPAQNPPVSGSYV